MTVLADHNPKIIDAVFHHGFSKLFTVSEEILRCNAISQFMRFEDAKLCHNSTERVVPVAVLPIGPESRTPSRRSEQD